MSGRVLNRWDSDGGALTNQRRRGDVGTCAEQMEQWQWELQRISEDGAMSGRVLNRRDSCSESLNESARTRRERCDFLAAPSISGVAPIELLTSGF